MANKRIKMREVRELLRLRFEQNKSAREAAKILGIGETVASQYISGFKASGLDFSKVVSMSDSDLLNAINPTWLFVKLKPLKSANYEISEPLHILLCSF